MIHEDANELVIARYKEWRERWDEGEFASRNGVCPRCSADLPKASGFFIHVVKFLGFTKDRCRCGWGAEHSRRYYWG